MRLKWSLHRDRFRYIVDVSEARGAFPPKRKESTDMPNPFTPPPGPFGFGFGPGDRRAFHQQRRQARREFRDNLRDHLHEHDAGPDFQGGFGPGRGFGGPGRGFEFGFDPRGGFGFGGPGGPRGRGRGGRGRGKSGGVRAAVLYPPGDPPLHG